MAEVTMYSTLLCPYCVRARLLLRQKKIAVTEFRVDKQPERREEMEKRSGRTSVPQIFIGDQHIGGCDDLFALHQSGKLDALLAES